MRPDLALVTLLEHLHGRKDLGDTANTKGCVGGRCPERRVAIIKVPEPIREDKLLVDDNTVGDPSELLRVLKDVFDLSVKLRGEKGGRKAQKINYDT